MNSDQLQKNFTYNARKLRRWAEYTQHEFSALIGIPRPNIGAIEEGRALGIENVYKYSKFFNVSMNDLIDTLIDTENMNPLID